MNPGGDVHGYGGDTTEELMFDMKLSPSNSNAYEESYSSFDDGHSLIRQYDQYRDQGEAFLLLREQEYYSRHGQEGAIAVSANDTSLQNAIPFPQISADGYNLGSPSTNPGQTEAQSKISTEDHRKKKQKPTKPSAHSKFSCDSLELTNMGLEEIPSAILENQHPIKLIYLQDNNIRELPGNFFDDLPYLAWCDLRFNEIAVLPDINKRHDTLRVLLLQENKLTSLPYSLGLNAVKLRTLSLRGNPLYDPPKEVINAGLDAIKYYMIQEIKYQTQPRMTGKELDASSRKKMGKKLGKKRKQKNKNEAGNDYDDGEDDLSEFEVDFSPQISGRTNTDIPNFTKALYKSITANKYKSKSQSERKDIKGQSQSIVGAQLKIDSESRPYFRGMSRKAATQLKYTNDVWRDIPFEGKSEKDLMHKSLEEMRQHISRKFSIQKEKMIQRIKDREVLMKWRFETRILQKAGRRPGTCCLVAPPYGVTADETVQEEIPTLATFKYIHLSPEEFQKEIIECSLKLQHFIENPASISDSEMALRRLHEVEEIQQKLCSLKLTTQTKCPIPS